MLATRHLLLTGQAISDVIESKAMGAIVGPAGLGKTFAIEHALEQHHGPVITLTFEARPTMRLVADRLLHRLTRAPGHQTRFAMTDQLLNRLSHGLTRSACLIVIGEAQNLNRDCFEYLRHLHDDPATRFGLLFDGGDGCWEVLAREPMLRSRIYRRVAFSPLSDSDVLTLNGSTPRSCAARSPARQQPVRPAVDVIVDPDDDIATTTAVQELAGREPGVLAISIAPDSCLSAQVVWAVLARWGSGSNSSTGPATRSGGTMLSGGSPRIGSPRLPCSAPSILPRTATS